MVTQSCVSSCTSPNVSSVIPSSGGGDVIQTLQTFIPEVLAEYDAANADSVPTPDQWRSITPAPFDGSQVSDWDMVADENAPNQTPVLTDAGLPTAYWLTRSASGSLGAEGDSFFRSVVSGVDIPAALRDAHRMQQDWEYSFVFHGTMNGTHAITSLLSTEGSQNSQGIRFIDQFSRNANRVIVLNDTGQSAANSTLSGGDSIQTSTEVIGIQCWRFNQTANTIEAKTYLNTNSPRGTQTRTSAVFNPPSTSDLTGNFFLYYTPDNNNAPPPTSQIRKTMLINKFITNEDAQIVIDYINGDL